MTREVQSNNSLIDVCSYCLFSFPHKSQTNLEINQSPHQNIHTSVIQTFMRMLLHPKEFLIQNVIGKDKKKYNKTN